MSRTVVSFTGLTASGSISISGIEVGDQVIEIMITSGATAGTPESLANFGAFIITNGELLQVLNSDFSSITFSALIERHATF